MKKFHIIYLAILLSIPLHEAYAQVNPCTSGTAIAKSITYQVNGQKVPKLQGYVTAGSSVTVIFSTASNSNTTRFSLVSYRSQSDVYSQQAAAHDSIYKSKTITVNPGGTGTMTVDVVPNAYFELDFVRGCVIDQPGPYGSNNYYENQSRLIDRAMGGNHCFKHNICGGPGNLDTCKKVTICHIPPGNPSNAHQITISRNAVAAHFRHHGDYYGPCKTPPPPPCDTCCVCDYDGNGKNDRIYGSTYYSVDNSIHVYFSAASDTAVITSTSKFQTVIVTYADFTTKEYDLINLFTFAISSTNPIVNVDVDGNLIENLAFTDPNLMCDCIPNPTPFPVTMTGFDAKVIDPGTVKLQWTTASETNNAYFQIEKSTDIMTWEDVPSCHVPGSGTTQQPHTYSCVDIRANQDGQNIVYYRNKQVDYDGAYEYSNTIHIRLENASFPTTVDKAYPNPMEDQIHIKYNSDDNGIFNIRVMSLDGKTLLSNEYASKKGAQIIDLDLPESRLKSGFYILEVKSDDQVFRQKIYKQ